jgi:hypothetical protein
MNSDGDYKVVCQRSGFTCLRSECRRTWDNKLVRWDFWEPRHPQDIIRPYSDNQSVPDGTPEPVDPPIFDGNLYYDLYLDYDTMLSYEVQSVFNVDLVI